LSNALNFFFCVLWTELSSIVYDKPCG
jgi:hypothetical protein